jgi:exodeoxyribonuclease V beta subunit
MKPLDPLALPLGGTTVIEASAGTGKTYTITTFVLRLLLEHELDIEQILVVTYTRAATAELRSRIRSRLSAALRAFQGETVDDSAIAHLLSRARERGRESVERARLERALASLDEAPVFTIHGFCQRTLADHAFDSGASFDSDLATDSGALLREIAGDYFGKRLTFGPRDEVEALRTETPEVLNKLALRVGATGMRILPEHVDAATLDLTTWRAAQACCRDLYASDKDRIRALVSSLSRASANIDSWCKALEEVLDAVEPGFLDEKNRWIYYFTTSGAAERLKKGQAPIAHPFLDAMERFVEEERAVQRTRRAMRIHFLKDFVDYAQHEGARRSEALDLRTFDGLLRELDEALSGPTARGLVEAVRKRYRAALVDEFQDTDPLQYRIFRALFGGGDTPLLLIGDPKQAIYGFRGADVYAYMRARDDAGDAVYTLDTNRRSDGPLVRALNRLYQQVERPFALSGIAYLPVATPPDSEARFEACDGRAPIDVITCGPATNANDLKQSVITTVGADLVRMLGSGCRRRDESGQLRALRPRDFAVLCRTNDEAKRMQVELSSLGVPAVLQGDASVLDSEDAVELERVLVALSHPSDARALRSLLCSFYVGLDAAGLFELGHCDTKWDEHRARVHRAHELWLSHGFMQAMCAFIDDYAVEQVLLRRPDGARRITNLWHLLELLAQAAIEHRLGALGIVRFLRLMRSDSGLRKELVGDAEELRLESSDDAALLTTIHKSKGLEYPLVYVPFVSNGNLLRGDDKTSPRFHDARAEGKYTLDLGSSDLEMHKDEAEHEALAEALRLLYVALTRAKHRVSIVIARGKSDKFERSALSYTLFGGGDHAALAERVKGLDPPAMQRALAELSERSAGGLSISSGALAQSAYVPPAGRTLALATRRATRSLDTGFRTTSFSALTSGERSTWFDAAADRDETQDAPELDAPGVLPLEEFPRGALAGQLVHEVLEHLDFGADTATLEALARTSIVARGYPEALVPQLTLGLSQMLDAPLDASGLCLRQLSLADRLNEMEFLFPIQKPLSPRALAQAFIAHDAPRMHPHYGHELRELGFDRLRGFLRGYVDLVFRHQGRYYVVDYKSNRLGPSARDYAPERLLAPMAEHHYFLQYHLYALALHRYLERRVADYSHERCFGGVYYLFLRGMAPQHPLGTGVFFDRPSEALLRTLDALMGRASEEASA